MPSIVLESKRNFKWPACKDGNAWFTKVSIKPDQEWIRYHCLNFEIFSIFPQKKVTCAFLLQDNIVKPPKTTMSFFILDKIKVSGVLWWIGHCKLCMERYLKLHLQSQYTVLSSLRVALISCNLILKVNPVLRSTLENAYWTPLLLSVSFITNIYF